LILALNLGTLFLGWPAGLVFNALLLANLAGQLLTGLSTVPDDGTGIATATATAYAF